MGLTIGLLIVIALIRSVVFWLNVRFPLDENGKPIDRKHKADS